MPSNSRISILFLLVIVTLFLYGVTKLLALRFEEGDVYPAYSSLRYDPVGTRALYESLESILDDAVIRNYDSLSRLDSGEKTTLIYLGIREYDRIISNEKLVNTLKRFTATGGRIIISFLPVTRTQSPKNPFKVGKKESIHGERTTPDKNKDERQEDKPPDKIEDNKKAQVKDKKEDRGKYLKEFWGFSFGYEKKRYLSGNAQFSAGSINNIYLPPVSWHTTLFFDNPDKDWNVIYTRDAHPVIMEKRLGKGSLVVSADSYFFSNEALLKERHPKLLSWIIGDSERVIFDESHFGIQKNLGIATLGRKYNLHWLFFALILFGLLFVWKNSVYFVTPPEKSPDKEGPDTVPSRDYKQGLISLLGRNVPKSRILITCSETWEKSVSMEKGDPAEKMGAISRVKEVIESERQKAGRQADPVKTYQEICNILSKRKII